MKSPLSGPSGPAETLADVLASGPLPLAAGLRCAHEVATELRDLHQQTRAYGNLTASSILMSGSGARLLPSRSSWDQAAALRDIRAFGAVFYQMLTGTLPSDALTAAEIRVEGPRTGSARLRSAALMLALNCRGSKGARLSMQQLATEIRLLGVLLRQYEANAKNAPAPGPFLVTVAPPSVPLEEEAVELLLNRLLPPYLRWLPRYPFRCCLPKPCPWKNRRRPPVPRHRWFPWDATASAVPLPRRLPNGSPRADAVRSAIARRFTFRGPARDSSKCWIAGACRSAAVTGATTATWFLRDSGFPRICPPPRSGSSAPAAATPDARKRRQPTIRP